LPPNAKAAAEPASAAAPRSEVPRRKRSRRKPVAERRRERREKRSGKQAHEPGDADRERPARVVGEDAERDEVHPLGGDRRAPGELSPP